MNKLRLVYIIPFVISLGCVLAYTFIDTYVAQDGTLVEPFGFVPVGMFFFAIGIIAAITVELIIKHNKNE